MPLSQGLQDGLARHCEVEAALFEFVQCVFESVAMFFSFLGFCDFCHSIKSKTRPYDLA